jgi:hypothetical protein
VRIVLDTNVVISALLWRGPPHELLSTLHAHPTAQLYSSPLLLAELADVLADYLEAIELVEPIASPRVARDPDDDQVLATALSARADCIVSGNADLLTLGSFENIRILSARQALATILG